MRRMVMLSVTLLCIVGSLQPARASVPAPLYERSRAATVKARNGVAVMATWDAKSASDGTLFPGDRLLVEGRNADGSWLRVHTYLGYGYVPASALEIQGDVQRLPVVEGNLPTTILPDPVVPDNPILP